MTEQELYEVFNNLRYHYENEVVEFKKAENNFDFDDLGKYFSALSNEANLRDKEFAWLVFGVENKSREILGTTYKNSMTSLQKLKHDLGQHTTDRNTFRDIFELKVEGKRVLMFQVPAAPRGILPMPDYDHSTTNEVVLNMPGGIIDENYSLMLLANQNLSLTDAVLLDQVQKGHPISHDAVAMLRKRKLIEGRLPHVYVSKDIAQATDQKVEYSKHKGLADKKCEALLLDSLNDHDSLTKQEIVRLLWVVLPDQLEDKQKMNKIEYLLKRLRKRGDVRNETKGNESVYSLGK